LLYVRPRTIAQPANWHKLKAFLRTERRGRTFRSDMRKFTAILHRGEPNEGGYWATCVEVPGANGQGETREECLASLSAAVQELLELNRAEAVAEDAEAELTELIVP
jgi:predicted RNase H-like HicB family nuclease